MVNVIFRLDLFSNFRCGNKNSNSIDRFRDMKIKFAFLLSTVLVIGSLIGLNVQGQGSDDYENGLTLKIDSSGQKYIRFIMWNQIWMRSIQHNPGTQVNGENTDHTWDVGARRIRFLAYAQITPRYLILTHFGINNQTFGSGGGSGTGGTGPYGAGKKTQLFFHDAYNEFALVPERNVNTNKENKASIYIGAGLHYWLGLSRMTAGSTPQTCRIAESASLPLPKKIPAMTGIGSCCSHQNENDSRLQLGLPALAPLRTPCSRGGTHCPQ